MSDAPQGQGWWQASDGKWYPPQSAPPAPAPPPYTILPAQRSAPGSAAGALVAAILAWVLCPVIPSIVSLVLAAKASREISESPGREGRGLVTASRIIAGVNLVVVPPMVLVAIALPTFFGAKERAQDRTAQSDLRNGVTVAKVFFTDNERWPSAGELAPIDPSLRFEPHDGNYMENVIDVEATGLLSLVTRSASGTCFYVIANNVNGAIAYAEDEDCGPVAQQSYVESWE